MSHDPDSRWGVGAITAFISHTHHHKDKAALLQSRLSTRGISSFVAHNDIEPLAEWRKEILRALREMDILIALMTPEFKKSDWTDQEVGVAIGRGVTVVPVGIGADPYGFLGAFQAFRNSLSDYRQASILADEIFTLCLNIESSRPKAKDAFVNAVSNARNFDAANRLASVLPNIDSLTKEQSQGLVSAFNENGQVSGAYDVIGNIEGELLRLTGIDHEIANGRLREVPFPISGVDEDSPFP